MVNGLKAFGGGIGFIVATPSVWLYSLVPMAVMLLLACGLAGLGHWGANWAVDYLIGPPESVWGHVGGWAVYLLLMALALVLAVLFAMVLAQPLSGFALEAIALAQERALTGYDMVRPPFFTVLLASLRVALVTLVVGGAAYAGLFLAGFVFPPAAVVTVPLKFVLAGWLVAWNFIDYPLGLRGMGLRARLGWVASNFGSFTSFGLAWAALLMVPGVFLVVLPMGVAGAARLVVAAEMGPLVRRDEILDVLPATPRPVRRAYRERDRWD